MIKVNIRIVSFRGIRETSEKFLLAYFILSENWGEATGNRGYRGKTGTAEVEVFYSITTNLVADFRPSLLETAK